MLQCTIFASSHILLAALVSTSRHCCQFCPKETYRYYDSNFVVVKLGKLRFHLSKGILSASTLEYAIFWVVARSYPRLHN